MEVGKNNKFNQNKEIFDLVRRAKMGDELAYKELMNRYKKAVFYLILKMVKNESDADDLTIEVFTKVFMNLDMYTENYSFSTWLFKIASNHAIDFLRRKKNKQRTVNIDEPINEETNWFMDLASEEPNPERELIIKQHLDEIESLIELLPKDIMVVIKMRVIDEMSYKEIAKKLNIPIGTVKARIFRGRNLLTSILKNKRNNFYNS